MHRQVMYQESIAEKGLRRVSCTLQEIQRIVDVGQICGSRPVGVEEAIQDPLKITSHVLRGEARLVSSPPLTNWTAHDCSEDEHGEGYSKHGRVELHSLSALQ